MPFPAYFFLFKQYFELAIIPIGLSREFLLHHYKILKGEQTQKLTLDNI